MGKIDYNQWKAQSQNASTPQADGPRVGYFVLKNDGDEAVVRFMCDDISDLDIIACHWAYVDGKQGWVNCHRDPKDPVEKCPFCSQDNKMVYRTFIHLLEYVRDEQGVVKAYARIWDRPASFISKLQNLINEYGPLSDLVFKVKRSGVEKATTYDILYTNPNVYRPEIYPKKEDAFKNYSVIGHAVREFKENKSGTEVKQSEITQEDVPFTLNNNYVNGREEAASQPSSYHAALQENPTTSQGYRTYGQAPQQNQQPELTRPKRFY